MRENYNPSNIFNFKNQVIPCKGGTMTPRLDGHGEWMLTKTGNQSEVKTKIDVWTLCRYMNDWAVDDV